MPRRISLALVGLLAAVALVGCGSDDKQPVSSGDVTTTTAAADFPVTVQDVTLTEAPTHIVSMSPTATETLFAIGAGDQVVAVDKYSNYPAEAPKGDLDAYEPNVEAIAAKQPDLVILSDAGDLADSLAELKIPVLVEAAPADVEGMYAEIAELGTATGHVAGAAEVIKAMKAGIAKVVADTEADGVSYFYELDSTLYSVTSKTFIGKVLGLIGLVNVADKAQATSDYPQLSGEYVIQSNPDLVLLADTRCCRQSGATVGARPGWSTLKAVQQHGVVELDDDIASRWGPRVVELLQTVATAAGKAKAAA